MTDVEDVLAAALRLPAEARAAVAAEIRQRLADVDAGRVTPIPWPEARRRILAAASGRGSGARRS